MLHPAYFDELIAWGERINFYDSPPADIDERVESGEIVYIREYNRPIEYHNKRYSQTTAEVDSVGVTIIRYEDGGLYIYRGF